MDERDLNRLAQAVAEILQMKGVRGLQSRKTPATGGRVITDIAARLTPPATRPPAQKPASRTIPRSPDALRVADLIDHTLLKAEASRAEIEKLCAEAAQYRFAAVCVNGSWVARCVELLAGTGVKVAAVAGFPLGATTSGAKASEVRQLIADGADEIDMVAPIGHVLDDDWDYVEDDMSAVVEAARGRTVKVILETAALDSTRIIKASVLAREAGASFVKTSTGFHRAGGATVEAVGLMRAAVGPTLGVKAAGGIRDCATALQMVAAGATRLGTSSGVKLVDCLGARDLPLKDVLDGAHQHARSCRTGGCESSY